MDPASVFFAALGIFIFGGITLAVYAYGLHQVGNTLAHKQKWHGTLFRSTVRICLWCLPILVVGFLFPLHTILQIGISVLAYLLHVQPLSVGYWTERVRIEQEDQRRFGKNVDDWLAEWECRETNAPGEL